MSSLAPRPCAASALAPLAVAISTSLRHTGAGYSLGSSVVNSCCCIEQQIYALGMASLPDPCSNATSSMAHSGFSGSLTSPRFDLAVDMGHPFLNCTVDGFLKIGVVDACKVAADETFDCLHRGLPSATT
ncbi:hypothetical protein E2562_005651 [Oryza meyeriana var. granulata]|uniref:Uncharacterized protein n=1 Tax=Oryza meyeriana var. granulata TaxID=110450 RepID=A0A6G1BJM1_9ORYZ|nr:hypothetical protein E2562_005651 [Oryza meyeriana var. granulata]